jgi:hypothetical protein
MTTTQGIENLKCGSNIDVTSLGRLGLSAEELQLVAEHARDGTLKDMLTVAEIALRRLDPEKMSTEFQVNNAMSKLREVSNTSFKTFMKQQILLVKYAKLRKQIKSKLYMNTNKSINL